MKKFVWTLFVLLISLILLGGCNNGDSGDSEEAPEQENGEVTSEDGEAAEDEGSTAESGSTDELIELAENFIDQLDNEQYGDATERFDETMEDLLSASDLEEIWISLESQFGEFEEHNYQTIESVEEYRVVILTGVFDGGAVTFQVTFDDDQRIAGFYYQ